jgi:hypothetical protein
VRLISSIASHYVTCHNLGGWLLLKNSLHGLSLLEIQDSPSIERSLKEHVETQRNPGNRIVHGPVPAAHTNSGGRQ